MKKRMCIVGKGVPTLDDVDKAMIKKQRPPSLG
jgi:hypothetical protein